MWETPLPDEKKPSVVIPPMVVTTSPTPANIPPSNFPPSNFPPAPVPAVSFGPANATPPVPSPSVFAGNGHPADPLIGATVGSYRISRVIGTGGMGTVYLAEQTFIGSKVAIKFLHEHLASNAQLVQRFYAEARAVNVIGHANIVSIFDMNVLPPNRYYLVMEYLEGKPLDEQLSGPMSPETALPILLQVCDALESAHQHGVVHRDLKPENIMLVKRGRQDNFVKILDFGIAKLFTDTSTSSKTATGVIIGTPDYMAPEQAGGDKIDGRCDIYSLGIIAYQMATGRTPFHGMPITAMLVAHLNQVPTPPHVVNPAVPVPLSMAIMKALAKQPDARYQTALDFARALEAAVPEGGKALVGSSPSRGSVLSSPSIPAAPIGAPPAPLPKMPSRVMVTPSPQSSASGINRTTPMRLPSLDNRPPTPVSPTPAPQHPRHVTQFDATVLAEGNVSLGTLKCQDVSRGGCFLCTTGAMPRIFSRVKVTLPRVGVIEGDVVRHVTPDQAKAWNMSPGFGVQFSSLLPNQRDGIDQLVKGLPVAPNAPEADASAVDDVVAEKVLTNYRKRINGDHYVVLGLVPEVEIPEVRARGRELKRELDELKKRPLSSGQLKQVESAAQRIQQALDVVGVATARVEYDGNRFNWKGVARCISAGLRVTELEEARKKFLTTHPGAETNGNIKFISANAFEQEGKFREALAGYEQALAADPLNLKFHQKYWALQRKLQ